MAHSPVISKNRRWCCVHFENRRACCWLCTARHPIKETLASSSVVSIFGRGRLMHQLNNDGRSFQKNSSGILPKLAVGLACRAAITAPSDRRPKCGAISIIIKRRISRPASTRRRNDQLRRRLLHSRISVVRARKAKCSMRTASSPHS